MIRKWGYLKKLRILCLLVFASIVLSVVGYKKYNLSNNKNMDVLNGKALRQYTIRLDDFGIKNDGSHPVETSRGINKALQYAYKNKYNKVIIPYGEYCISEVDPIIMPNDMEFDLNKATFRINTNGLEGYSIFKFAGCKNAEIMDGTLLGDRYTHDYNTIKSSHEWAIGVVFDDSENCELDKITIMSFPGYGVYTSMGNDVSNSKIRVTVSNLEAGNISKTGNLNKDNNTIRTIEPLDISNVGGEFELGYNKGYMGYPFITSNTYDAYFYNKDMKFITSNKMCKQYKKIIIPDGAKYVHFVFQQKTVPLKGDLDFNNATIFLTNYKSPNNIKIVNCSIEDNRSLGIGLCGGRNVLIENNMFKSNGGGLPGYAIDIEDGWEYMDKFTIKDNKFINNINDVVVCAGDNIIFDNNGFSSTVYVWERTTNYKFINNKFENIKQSINYEYSTDTVITGNTYINCKINLISEKNSNILNIENEKLINSYINRMNEGVELKNSKIVTDSSISVRLVGSYRNCSINSKGGDYISTSLFGCKIEDAELNCEGNIIFDNCEFTRSSTTTSNIKSIKINKCKFEDSYFLITTWGSETQMNVESSKINMLTGTNSFINISAGRISNLIFKDNTVVNKIDKPVFNMYDTTYNLPNGKTLIENNVFEQLKYPYIFDGVNITQGYFNFSNKNNIIKGANLLNKKYINNKYFSIS